MKLKGLFKEKTSSFKIFFLLLLVALSYFFHTMLALVIISLIKTNPFSLLSLTEVLSQNSIVDLKLFQLFSSLGLFLTPMLIYSHITCHHFNFNKLTRQSVILAICIMVLILPFISLTVEIIKSLNLPEYIIQSDRELDQTTKKFLKMSNYSDLLFNILLIAIIPAIGEELVFRGYLQKKISKRLSNIHISIFITAVIFSAIHFHFQAFIARFILGLVLGYLFVWSKSIWLPILAHFINNFQALLVSFFMLNNKLEIDHKLEYSNTQHTLGLFSLLSVLMLLFILHQHLKYENEKKDQQLP